MVIPLGLEPKTVCLEGRCSIQLSYGTIFCGCKETGIPGTIRAVERSKRSREQIGFDGGPAGVACHREFGGKACRKIRRTVEAIEVGHY